jgi:hypothetical protein
MTAAPAGGQRAPRRLRLALVAVSMLCAILVLALGVVLVYWDRYLLSASGDPFTRGPFVLRVDETSAVLRWRVRDGARVQVVASADGRSVRARGGELAGLAPGRRYTWAASVDGHAAATGSFRTAPRRMRAPITFAVIGDYGSGNDHEYAVGRVLAAQAPAFVLTAGDNSYLAAAPVLLDRNIFEPLRPLLRQAPLVPTMGEHDLFWRGGEAIQHAFDLPGSRGRYVMRYGPIQVVLLGLEAGPAERRFAAAALRRPGPALRFVVVHRPIQAGNPILPILRRAGVAAVFAGHLHRYERRVVDGVLEFTVGTSGEGAGDLRFTRPTAGADVSRLDFGGLRVDAGPGGVLYTFLDERGRVIDRLRR